MYVPILCLDFDGVIHGYQSGWKGAAIVPDPPVPGALDFLLNAADHFNVQIFSSRSNHPGGREAMQEWLIRHMLDRSSANPEATLAFVTKVLKWPLDKPAAMITIDDRALTFTGKWPAIEDLKAFKTWQQK